MGWGGSAGPPTEVSPPPAARRRASRHRPSRLQRPRQHPAAAVGPVPATATTDIHPTASAVCRGGDRRPPPQNARLSVPDCVRGRQPPRGKPHRHPHRHPQRYHYCYH
ncbi:hypothetical protein I4F81_003274 [Pyropia yezoensis]|uniref:Uncharacterized protein n=1 Tax=Pyropia yezoensis TaxID=2788 RepID=A0ACC3BRQ3_PYRYE|nr:hypothetical protein I4F81_003274 [Neopyropia yezoensis]